MLNEFFQQQKNNYLGGGGINGCDGSLKMMSDE